VRRGDTLYSIAFQYDLDFRSLAIANNLNPPYTIRVDQELNLDASNPGSLSSNPLVATPTGTVVTNNSVASARGAATTPATVIRQSIGGARNQEPEWRWPLSGRVLNGFTANGANKGIDIGASAGQPVLAAADGDVVYAGNTIQGSGNLIIIRHNDRYLSAYAQNRSLLVAQGTQVRTGDTIAEVGQGTDGVPRLHFEIRLDGKPVDPMGYLPRQ
jgi:lipoprotein NlpD